MSCDICIKFKLPPNTSRLYFIAFFSSLGHISIPCNWCCFQIATPLKKAKFLKKSQVLKMARDSNAERQFHEGVKQTKRCTFCTAKGKILEHNHAQVVRKCNQLCFRWFNTFYKVWVFFLSPPLPAHHPKWIWIRPSWKSWTSENFDLWFGIAKTL